MNINKVIVIGRITQDLELKKMPNGNNVLDFSVATNYVYKDKDGNKVEQVEFHNIKSFGKQSETIVQYFIKGQEIYIEGRLKTSTWDDKESGKKMYKTEIILEKFDFGAKPVGTTQGASTGYKKATGPTGPSTQNQPQKKDSYPDEDINPEDIPF